jgi:NADPH:quinone reductase-like Zn-dependent oxidoreductase
MSRILEKRVKRIEVMDPPSIDGLALVDLPQPEPGPGEVMVRVRASSLNFHDYLVVTGVMAPEAGRVPLSDGAGEVVSVGSAVTTLVPGDRVIGTYFTDWLDGSPTAGAIRRMRGEQVDGFASEFVVKRESDLVKVPQGLSHEEAATLPCAGLTAWRALMVEGRLKPGDTVLVQGTGGVSIFALQFARMAGAEVIALTSSDAKREKLEALGARHVLNYREEPEWGSRVKALTGGRGVDHVVEVVGGDLTQTLRACRVGGQVLMVGALSRKPIQFPAGLVITGNIHVTGLTVGSRAHLEQMMRAIARNELRPVIDRVFPLAEIKDAFRHQEAKAHFGKICIAI